MAKNVPCGEKMTNMTYDLNATLSKTDSHSAWDFYVCNSYMSCAIVGLSVGDDCQGQKWVDLAADEALHQVEL